MLSLSWFYCIIVHLSLLGNGRHERNFESGKMSEHHKEHEQAGGESQEAEIDDDGELEVPIELCKNGPEVDDHPEHAIKTTENESLLERELTKTVGNERLLDQGDEPLRDPTLRYANPHGTFITGIDVNSEVRDHDKRFVVTRPTHLCNINTMFNILLGGSQEEVAEGSKVWPLWR